MLSILNNDTPGFVGAVGTFFGEAGINIAMFSLGREKPGGESIALIEVDAPVPEAILAKLKALPQVVRVTSLNF
jgi:D-3-phosphoglycerate dehydrogenase